MSTQDLQQALTTATEAARQRHPALTDEDVRAAYESYHRHFTRGEDDPPVSHDPAVDDLLLSLWDVIVDRELAGTDADVTDLDQHYRYVFTNLLSPTTQELQHVADRVDTIPEDEMPLAVATSPVVDTEDPAPVLPPEIQQADMVARKEEEPLPIYQLKISLDGSQPEIWRRVLVPSHITLVNLHHVIQSAMGWSESHMYQFYPQQDRPIARTGGAQLSDLLVNEGEICGYEYDFGDSWYHNVELERKLPADPNRQYPVCTGGQRACPPEDIGGIPGYGRMLDILKDPSQPEYEDMAGWLTQDFNPAAFNIDQANLRLARHGRAGFQAAT